MLADLISGAVVIACALAGAAGLMAWVVSGQQVGDR